MILNNTTKAALTFTLLAFSTTQVAANSAVAISASYKTGSVGFGSGGKKNAAGNAAKSDCKKGNAGKSCKYWYWTKNSSHMAMIRCKFPIGTREEGEFAVQGGHSNASLKAAKANAYKNLTKKLRYNGLKATAKNCDVIATYSNGAFKDQ